MADPIKIAELLASYGGWGVAALSIVANVVLFRLLLKKYDSNEKSAKLRNEQAFAMLEKRVEVDHRHAQGYEKLCAVVKNSNELSKKVLEKL